MRMKTELQIPGVVMTPVALRGFVVGDPNFQFCSVLWDDQACHLYDVNPYTNMLVRIKDILPPEATKVFSGRSRQPTRYAIAFTPGPMLLSLFPEKVWRLANVSIEPNLVVLPCPGKKVVEFASMIESTVLKNFQKQKDQGPIDEAQEEDYIALLRSIVTIRMNFI